MPDASPDDYQDSLASLTRSIVAEFDPSGLNDYDVLAESYFHPPCLHLTDTNDSSDYDRFGFGVDGETGMLCLHIVVGTLALTELFLSARRIREEKVSLDQIRETWKNLLVQNGLSPELAQAIPVRFGAEMLELLTRAKSSRKNKRPKT